MCRRGKGKGRTGELLMSLTTKSGTENVPTDVVCHRMKIKYEELPKTRKIVVFL